MDARGDAVPDRGRAIPSPAIPGVAEIDAALDELSQVASAAKHGDQLAAVIVDAHAAGFRRLLELAAERGDRGDRGDPGDRGDRGDRCDPGVLTSDAALAEVFWLHEAAGAGAALETMGARLDTLRSSIEQCGVPGLLAAADRLVESLTEMYGWALGRAVELLHDSGQAEALQAAIEDPLIAALLLSHGMHPQPLAERVQHVLDATAQALAGQAGHAGRIELLEASDHTGGVRLRISGGDEKQRWRTRLAVERAIRELVADATELDVEGAEPEPRGSADPAIIPITSIGRRRRTTRWAEVPALADLADGGVTQVTVDGVDLLACRVGNDWFVTPDPHPDRSSTSTLRLVATAPPIVEAGDGRRLELTDPLPTHVDNGIVEVALPR